MAASVAQGMKEVCGPLDEKTRRVREDPECRSLCPCGVGLGHTHGGGGGVTYLEALRTPYYLRGDFIT